MNTVNAILTELVDTLFLPFNRWPAQVALLFFSVATGLLVAWVFRQTSNQSAIKAATNRVGAQLLAIKLFKEDLGVTFRSQVELMKGTGLRLWHALPPMLVLLVPTTVILTQLGLRYEHQPLAPGESVVVELQLSPSQWDLHKDVAIEVPPNITVETAPVRDARQHTVSWRIRPEMASPGPLRWQLCDGLVEKSLAVAEDPSHPKMVSVRRPGSHWLDRLVHPGEPGFDSESCVRAIVVHFPQRPTPMLGVDVPWWGTFFIVAMLTGILARPWLKVHF